MSCASEPFGLACFLSVPPRPRVGACVSFAFAVAPQRVERGLHACAREASTGPWVGVTTDRRRVAGQRKVGFSQASARDVSS